MNAASDVVAIVAVRAIVAAARKLRRRSTDVERTLWQQIRNKQIAEFRFRRQRPIGKYIVDFVCLDAKLIVELDGGQHGEDVAYDTRRTAFLESLGFRVLRFWNNEVIENMEGVLARVLEQLQLAESNPSLALQAAPPAASGDRSTGEVHAPQNPGSTLPVAGVGTDRSGVEVVAIAETRDKPKSSAASQTLTAPAPSPALRGKAGMGVPENARGSKPNPAPKATP